MEIRQLEHFVATAEEGHFSRAAERSNIVQSGLSASIRSLERELDTRLFDRTTRRVASSHESGRALLPEARRVLAAATGAREAVAGVEGLVRGTLSIGIMQSLVAVRLPAMLARFRTLHPGVNLRLRQAGTTILLEEVRDGGLELAFASVARSRCRRAWWAMNCSTRRCCSLARPNTHLRTAVRSASRASARSPSSTVIRRWGIRISTDRAFADAGIDRRVAFEVNDMPTLLDLVAHGLGVALLPAIARAASHAAAFRAAARQASALERDAGCAGAHGAERGGSRLPRDGDRRGRLGGKGPRLRPSAPGRGLLFPHRGQQSWPPWTPPVPGPRRPRPELRTPVLVGELRQRGTELARLPHRDRLHAVSTRLPANTRSPRSSATSVRHTLADHPQPSAPHRPG